MLRKMSEQESVSLAKMHSEKHCEKKHPLRANYSRIKRE